MLQPPSLQQPLLDLPSLPHPSSKPAQQGRRACRQQWAGQGSAAEEGRIVASTAGALAGVLHHSQVPSQAQGWGGGAQVLQHGYWQQQQQQGGWG
jgi:hypothetical protein